MISIGSPDNYAEIVRHFSEISPLTGIQRQNRVNEITDAAIRDAVLKRLAKKEQLAAFRALEHEFKYEILDEIGRGGVGVVYRANQKGLNRTVALKLFPRDHFQSSDHARALLDAAQIAAGLDHPGILKIFDAGIKDGQLYIAMEHMPGGSLAAWMANKPMEPNAAVRMAREIARAIAHAHARNIVHRDLKPENVLLDADGNAKVADFDLLAIVTPDRDGDAKPMALGTPSYMSPEQAKGEQISCASDVYSLGSLFYAMLTGRPPFESASVDETLQDLIGRDPVEPRALNPRIPRDVETICLKCLRKAPSQRYIDAGELADDLTRYLEKKPIKARSTTKLERAAKWVGRNRAVTILSSLAIVMLIAGVIATTHQARVAIRARRISDANLSTSLNVLDYVNREIVGVDLARVPEMNSLRKKILERNLSFYEGLLAENRTAPQVLEGGLMYLVVGDIRQALGQLDAAENAFRRAIDLYEPPAIQDRLQDPHARHAVVRAMNSLANLQRQLGRNDRWNQELVKFDEFLSKYPADVREQEEYLEVLAGLRHNQTQQRFASGEFDVAEAFCRESIAVKQKLVERLPENSEYRRSLARGWATLGNVLNRLGKTDDARQAYEVAIRLFEVVANARPDEDEVIRDVATTYRTIARLHKRSGQPELAAEYYQKAHDQLAELVARNPQVPDYRHELAETLNGVSGMVSSDNAATLMAEAVAHERLACELSPQNTVYRRTLRNHSLQLASSHTDRGDHRQAAPLLLEFLQMADRCADYVFGAYHLSVCSTLAAKDPKLSTGERERLSREYRDTARQQLETVKGQGELTRDVLATPLFERLRSSSEFMQLVDVVLD